MQYSKAERHKLRCEKAKLPLCASESFSTAAVPERWVSNRQHEVRVFYFYPRLPRNSDDDVRDGNDVDNHVDGPIHHRRFDVFQLAHATNRVFGAFYFLY